MNLEISATEHAFVEHEGLSNKMWFRELHVGVSRECQSVFGKS